MLTTEVAELTGKRHADVMRDTRNMLEQLGLGERNFASSYLSPQNKEVPCYRLPERELLVLLTGYNLEEFAPPWRKPNRRCAASTSTAAPWPPLKRTASGGW